MTTVMAAALAASGYFSPAKIIVVLVMLVPWMLVAPWVHRDAKRVLAPVPTWSGVILGAGALGFVLWVVIPTYTLGLLAYLAIVGTTATVYLVYRNGRCREDAKITFSTMLPALLGGAGREKKVELLSRVKLYSSTTRTVLPPGDDASQEQRLAYNDAQSLLFDLIFHRASEADLTPSGRKCRVRLVIDGVVTEHEPMDLEASEMAIQYLKLPAGMDVDERRRPQKGTVAVDALAKHTEIMLTTTGTTGGQRMQFRIVGEAVKTDLDELGFSPDTLEQICTVNSSPTGLIIVSGRRKSGLTSTLYALLRRQDAFMKQLTTCEANPLIDLENVTQNQYESPADLPRLLTITVRRDPDVIMVDRCPDETTADLIRQISKVKLVLLGMQARDSFVALAKWTKACGDAEKAVANLLGISCQLLLRKLCLECRHAYKPDPQLLAKANISGENIGMFYRKADKDRADEKGKPLFCNACQESGFIGRAGVFEFLSMTDAIRKLIIDGTDVRTIKGACRKSGMLNLQEQALKKVIAGVTSINEVIRVTQESKKSQQPTATGPTHSDSRE